MNAFNWLLMAVIVNLAGIREVQSQTADSLYASAVSQNLTKNYLLAQSNHSPVFNGRVYLPYVRLTDGGHTFFDSNQYSSGSITFMDYTYENLNIAYDIVRDQLILVHFDKNVNVIVKPEFVSSFSFNNHTFINLKPESVNNGISPGYYDLLYNGKIALLAKRQKAITETVTQFDVKRTVSATDKYYLQIDSVYRQIKSKSDLSKLLKSTHSQNQQFIRANKLNFKRDREKFILSLVRYHNSLRE